MLKRRRLNTSVRRARRLHAWGRTCGCLLMYRMASVGASAGFLHKTNAAAVSHRSPNARGNNDAAALLLRNPKGRRLCGNLKGDLKVSLMLGRPWLRLPIPGALLSAAPPPPPAAPAPFTVLFTQEIPDFHSIISPMRRFGPHFLRFHPVKCDHEGI